MSAILFRSYVNRHTVAKPKETRNDNRSPQPADARPHPLCSLIMQRLGASPMR
jgi:hypothetical protein